MKKIKLEKDVIEQILQITDDFESIDKFCERLENTQGQLIKDLLKEYKISFPKINRRADNIELIRKNFYIREDEEIEESEETEQETLEQENNQFPEEDLQKEIVINSQKDISTNVFILDFDSIKESFEQEGYLKLQPLKESIDYDVSDDIVLVEDMMITQQDEFKICISQSSFLPDCSKILLVKAETPDVVALGRLIADTEMIGYYFVVFDRKEWILYDRFSNENRYRLILFSGEQVYSLICNINYKPFETELERPLCIDFGTSNTTAGSYGILSKDEGEKEEIVHFIDVTSNAANNYSVLIPTIVYVKDCSDLQNIQYLFGYEAKKRVEEEHYESDASVFYELKRWITSIDEIEEIRDAKNNSAVVSRKEIIKAYIDYIIECSEQYFKKHFKKLHFSAPIKLKGKFISVLQEMYQDQKEILSKEESVDEGIAIIYNRIVRMIYEMPDYEKKHSVMILDCGGGTTDQASCEYKFEDLPAGKKLIIETSFENGNSNFGGNNITYRIMQLLKIKMAAAYKKQLFDYGGEISKLIDKTETAVLAATEAAMNRGDYNSDKANEVYQKFVENYERAEAVIPTIFIDNKKYTMHGDRKKIRRNFYYLWQKAEQIKIEFYKGDRVSMDFCGKEQDKNLVRDSYENYYLYFADENGKLYKESDPMKNVEITIKEINRVLCGDIYGMLCGLFYQEDKVDFGRRKPSDFDFYKLSGQSCKISLFSSLLKEYVPGRKLRPIFQEKKEETSEDLKLDCLKGSIQYVRDQRGHELNVVITSKAPEVIYDIVLKGNHGKDRVLFDKEKQNEIPIELFFSSTKELKLEVINKLAIVERSFSILLQNNINWEEAEQNNDLWTVKEIGEQIKNKIRDAGNMDKAIEELKQKLRKIDPKASGSDTISIVFVIPANDGYGIWFYQVIKRKTEDKDSYMIFLDYECFEDASKTFFNGKR